MPSKDHDVVASINKTTNVVQGVYPYGPGSAAVPPQPGCYWQVIVAGTELTRLGYGAIYRPDLSNPPANVFVFEDPPPPPPPDPDAPPDPPLTEEEQ